MNVSTFFEHWGIAENPFRAEEARHDPVFARLGPARSRHPDFEKVLGDLFRPSTSIVFGEKGSGKTAMRLQIAEQIAQHNDSHRRERIALIPYDDLNPILDQFAKSVAASDHKAKKQDITKTLSRIRLTDHMDAMLALATTRLVDALVGRTPSSRHNPPAPKTNSSSSSSAPSPDNNPADHVTVFSEDLRTLRRAHPSIKRDLLILAAAYDTAPAAALRLTHLRRRIKGPANLHRFIWKSLAVCGWILPVAVVILQFLYPDFFQDRLWWLWIFYAALGIWGFFLIKFLLWDRFWVRRLARRISRHMRTTGRTTDHLAGSIARLRSRDRDPREFPIDDHDEHRFAMFARLHRVLVACGFRGAIIVVDRVDEPTLINGDAGRMRAVVWPMFNNKFLQQEGIGVKMLLPIELRHELFRESTAFFQEARLDKQSLVERLVWTGPMLFDLCNARLAACRGSGAETLSLTDLFEPDVSRQDIVDALDQMHQPRDAFKLLYRCIQEHCSNVTDEMPKWRIPRLVLDTVRKQESDRVQMFYRGIRPA